jgi:hypothetical protein
VNEFSREAQACNIPKLSNPLPWTSVPHVVNTCHPSSVDHCLKKLETISLQALFIPSSVRSTCIGFFDEAMKVRDFTLIPD